MPGPDSGDRGPAAAAAQVLRAVRTWRSEHSAAAPLVIAIDGHGAAGKSSIAGLVAGVAGAALVHTDDFFTEPPRPVPGGAGSPDAGLAIGCYYDWSRLRAEALEPLRAGRAASFRRFDPDCFDPEHGRAADAAGADGLVTVQPSVLIVVEGVSSGAPALSGLVHRSVFVDTPAGERMRRLRLRVRPEEWDDEWLAAEQAYFSLVRPPSSFDLVVSGAGAIDGGAVTYA
jgi:uridine kinase